MIAINHLLLAYSDNCPTLQATIDKFRVLLMWEQDIESVLSVEILKTVRIGNFAMIASG
jgi:hypothetical protein